jgi:hypothetical protein
LLSVISFFSCSTTHVYQGHIALSNAQILLKVDAKKLEGLRSLVKEKLYSKQFLDFKSTSKPFKPGTICLDNDGSSCFVSGKIPRYDGFIPSAASNHEFETAFLRLIFVTVEPDNKDHPEYAYISVQSGPFPDAIELAFETVRELRSLISESVGDMAILKYDESGVVVRSGNLIAGINQCHDNSDCAVVKGVCGTPIAINRHFVSEFPDHPKRPTKAVNCAAFLPEKPWPDGSAAICRKHSCTLNTSN